MAWMLCDDGLHAWLWTLKFITVMAVCDCGSALGLNDGPGLKLLFVGWCLSLANGSLSLN